MEDPMNRFRVVSFATVLASLTAALTAGGAHAAPPLAFAQSAAAAQEHQRGRSEGHARPAPSSAPRGRPPAAPPRAAPAPQARRFAPVENRRVVNDNGRGYNERNFDRGVVHHDRAYPERGYRDYRRDVDVRHRVYGGRDYDRFFRERYAYRPYWRSYGYAFLPPAIAIYPSLSFLSDGVCVGSYWQFGHDVYVYAVMRFGVREQIVVRDDGVILSEEPLPDYGY
jgi:hypothetical protein